MSIFWLTVIIELGLIVSAFFSGIETGLISLNRVRLRHEVERKNRRALILHGFVSNTEKLLGITLAGSNLCNVLVAVAFAALAHRLFGQHWAVDLTATVISAVIVLVVAEMVPKLLFRHYAHRLCLTFADVLSAMAWLLAPLVWFLGMLMNFIAWVSGRDDEQPTSFFVSREELKHLAKEGEVGGALTSEERQMIHGVFDLPYQAVQEVMVPLSRAVTVTPETGLEELLGISQRTGYARFPVREGGKVAGVVNIYEILFIGTPDKTQKVRDHMRKPQFVLALDRVNRVLPLLRASRMPLSVVLGPDGKAIGIVTIEDIVEEIVGEVEG